MKRFFLCAILTTGISFLLAGCRDVVYPVPIKGSANTFGFERKWWDRNVVNLKVLTSDQASMPNEEPHFPGWIGPCHESEDFGQAPSFTTVWQIRATREISARDFKVIPGIVPDGFEQVIPESERFCTRIGESYYILVCLEPIDDSV
jgi:hypothetical protein